MQVASYHGGSKIAHVDLFTGSRAINTINALWSMVRNNGNFTNDHEHKLISADLIIIMNLCMNLSSSIRFDR